LGNSDQSYIAFVRGRNPPKEWVDKPHRAAFTAPAPDIKEYANKYLGTATTLLGDTMPVIFDLYLMI
jgi:hypothetical protein